MPSKVFAAIILAAAAIVVCGGCSFRSRPVNPIGHYVEGVVLAEAGKFEAALLELSKSIEDDPELSVAYAAVGDIHFRRGHLPDARVAYAKACEVNPYSFPVHYRLGLVCTKLVDLAASIVEAQKFLKEAISAYLRSLEIEPDDYDANINLCACYFQDGKFRLAEKYCKEAIRIRPDSADAHSTMGLIFGSQKRLHEAVRWYKMSLELDARQPDLLLQLTSIYMRQKRWRQTLSVCKSLAAQEPKWALPWVQMGVCYGQMSRFPEAVEACRKALVLSPDSHAAHEVLGNMYMVQYLQDKTKTDLRDQGLEEWHRSLEIKSDQPKIRRRIKKYTPRDP